MKRNKLLATAISVLGLAVAGILFGVIRPQIAHANTEEHVTDSNVAFYYNVPYAYSETISTGIGLYPAPPYVGLTEVNWSGVIPGGKTRYPRVMGVSAGEWIRDGNGNYWYPPDNNPNCFVDGSDSYDCGDTDSINHLVYTGGNQQPVAHVNTFVVTNDQYNDTWTPFGQWPLSDF